MNNPVLPILLTVVAFSTICNAYRIGPSNVIPPRSLSSSYSNGNLLDSIRNIAGSIRWDQVLQDAFDRFESREPVAPIIVRLPGPIPKGQLREVVRRLEALFNDLWGQSTSEIEDVGPRVNTDALVKGIKEVMEKEKEAKEEVVSDMTNVKSVLKEVDDATKQSELLKEVGDYLNNKTEEASQKMNDREQSVKQPPPLEDEPIEQPVSSTTTEVPDSRSGSNVDEMEPPPNPIAGISAILKEEARKLTEKEPEKSSEEQLKEQVQQLKASLKDLVGVIDQIIESGE